MIYKIPPVGMGNRSRSMVFGPLLALIVNVQCILISLEFWFLLTSNIELLIILFFIFGGK